MENADDEERVMKPMPYSPPARRDDGLDMYFVYRTGAAAKRWTLASVVDDLVAHKKLTDAECAAEYWHAASYVHYAADQIRAGRRDPEFVIAAKLQVMEADVWQRFHRHPHAHEAG